MLTLNGRAYSPAELVALVERLTPREHEVLAMLAGGIHNDMIAKRLYVSRTTVKTHVEHIIRKLGVVGRTQAAVVGALVVVSEIDRADALLAAVVEMHRRVYHAHGIEPEPLYEGVTRGHHQDRQL